VTRVVFDPPYREDIEAAINEEGVDDSEARRLTFVQRYGKSIEREILRLLDSHPLDAARVLANVTEITVRIDASWPPASLSRINCAGWPRIVLTLREDRDAIEELYPILCHEFTHVIDRLDPRFGLPTNQSVPPEIMKLWHCSIDGRLARKGIVVPHEDDVHVDPTLAQIVSACDWPSFDWLAKLACQ